MTARLFAGILGMGIAAGGAAVTVLRRKDTNDYYQPTSFAGPFEAETKEVYSLTQFHRTPWIDNWDGRDPAELNANTELDSNISKFVEPFQVKKPKTSRHLILIRHGQYQQETNVDHEKVLTTLGRTQAEMTGNRLKDLGLPYDVLYNSDMVRAQETADIIAKTLPSVPREEYSSLREGAPYPPEPPSSSSWSPGTKKFIEDSARIESAFKHFFHRASPDQKVDSYEILVCHANVIRYFVCRVLQFPPEGWLRISLFNGSITWVTIRPNGRVSLRILGDVGHMPKKFMTTS